MQTPHTDTLGITTTSSGRTKQSAKRAPTGASPRSIANLFKVQPPKLERDGCSTGLPRNALTHAAYVAINFVSCVGIAMYFAGAISAWHEILFFEAPLTFIKALLEISTGDFTFDIALHHGCFAATMCAVRASEATAQYTWLLVQMHVVHLPLTLANAKRLLSVCGPAYLPLKNEVDSAFLLTWAISILYRCTTICAAALRTLNEGQWVPAAVIVPCALAFVFLDYYWTPWKKYQDLVANAVNLPAVQDALRSCQG
jgi:hypothetical protein